MAFSERPMSFLPNLELPFLRRTHPLVETRPQAEVIDPKLKLKRDIERTFLGLSTQIPKNLANPYEKGGAEDFNVNGRTYNAMFEKGEFGYELADVRWKEHTPDGQDVTKIWYLHKDRNPYRKIDNEKTNLEKYREAFGYENFEHGETPMHSDISIQDLQRINNDVRQIAAERAAQVTPKAA